MGSADDALDREYDELLTAKDVADRLVDIISFELFADARRLFGDRATPWVVATLRTTASMIEHLPVDLLTPPPDDRS